MTIQRPLRPYLLCKRTGRVYLNSFLPTDIDSLVAWFSSNVGLYQERTGASASTLSENDGDPVGTWRGITLTEGEYLYATCDADAKRPTLKTNRVNGLSGILFDGIDDKLTSLFTLNQPFSFYVLGRYITAGDSQHLISGNGNVYFYTRDSLYFSMGAGLALFKSDYLVTQGQFHVAKAAYSGASSRISLDNNADNTGTNPGTDNAGGIHFGSFYPDTGYCGNVELIDVLAFSEVLSTANDLAVKEYLNVKAGGLWI